MTFFPGYSGLQEKIFPADVFDSFVNVEEGEKRDSAGSAWGEYPAPFKRALNSETIHLTPKQFANCVAKLKLVREKPRLRLQWNPEKGKLLAVGPETPDLAYQGLMKTSMEAMALLTFAKVFTRILGEVSQQAESLKFHQAWVIWDALNSQGYGAGELEKYLNKNFGNRFEECRKLRLKQEVSPNEIIASFELERLYKATQTPKKGVGDKAFQEFKEIVGKFIILPQNTDGQLDLGESLNVASGEKLSIQEAIRVNLYMMDLRYENFLEVAKGLGYQEPFEKSQIDDVMRKLNPFGVEPFKDDPYMALQKIFYGRVPNSLPNSSSLGRGEAGIQARVEAFFWLEILKEQPDLYFTFLAKKCLALEHPEGVLLPRPDGYGQYSNTIHGDGAYINEISGLRPEQKIYVTCRGTSTKASATQAGNTILDDIRSIIGKQGSAFALRALKENFKFVDGKVLVGDQEIPKMALIGFSLGANHAKRIFADMYQFFDELWVVSGPGLEPGVMEKLARNLQKLEKPPKAYMITDQGDMIPWYGAVDLGYGLEPSQMMLIFLQMAFPSWEVNLATWNPPEPGKEDTKDKIQAFLPQKWHEVLPKLAGTKSAHTGLSFENPLFFIRQLNQDNPDLQKILHHDLQAEKGRQDFFRVVKWGCDAFAWAVSKTADACMAYVDASHLGKGDEDEAPFALQFGSSSRPWV